MSETKKLGDLLKEAGLIDDFQLEAALSHQRNWGGKLGAVLVDLEFAREEEIARVLSEKVGVPYVDLFEPEIPQDVIHILKPDIAKKFNVVPVRRESNALVLAMADPLDLATMDNVRFITNLTIKPVLSMPSEIADALRKYYDGETVNRKGRISFHETAKASTRMEIVREVPDIATAEWSQQHPQQGVEALRQDVATQKRVLEALVALLIEKGLISRDELAKIIEQKKMGV